MNNTITVTMPDNVPTYLLAQWAHDVGLELKHDSHDKKSFVSPGNVRTIKRMNHAGTKPGTEFTPPPPKAG